MNDLEKDMKLAGNILECQTFSDFIPYLQTCIALRAAHAQNRVDTCAIVNAKCGACTENCAFCPQSIRSTSSIQTYDLMSAEALFDAAKKAQDMGAHRFGIVTSGRTVNSQAHMHTLCKAIKKMRTELKILPCASLGLLERVQLQQLKEAGLTRYHHNLETARSFFPNVCTTRSYDDQLHVIRDAAAIGLPVCSGGLFGMGETDEQRLELLQTLREENVDSMPINFLHPQKGTRLETRPFLTPFEALKIVAAARVMLPQAYIRICGGREATLRDYQSYLFAAGADALMIGNYLITSGRSVQSDFEMIKDFGLSPEHK